MSRAEVDVLSWRNTARFHASVAGELREEAQAAALRGEGSELWFEATQAWQRALAALENMRTTIDRAVAP